MSSARAFCQGVAIFEQGFSIHRPLQLRRLQAVEVILRGLEIGADLLLIGLEFLRELHALLLQLPQLAAPLLIPRLGAGDIILEATKLDLGTVMALLEVLVPLLETFVLIEKGLAVDRPLELGILQLIGLLLLGCHLAFHQRQLFFLLFQLRADVFLQRLEMHDELLVLLEDVGERLRLGRLGTHQAAFRGCWR